MIYCIIWLFVFIIIRIAQHKESLNILKSIHTKLIIMDRTLEETLELVRENATMGGSLIALFKEQKKKLDDILSGVTLPPEVQAKINALYDVTKADSDAIGEAIVAGTPNE